MTTSRRKQWLLPLACLVTAATGALISIQWREVRLWQDFGFGLMTIGLAVLPLGLLVLVMGRAGFGRVCRVPQEAQWLKRGVVAGSLSLVGLIVLGAVLGVVSSSGANFIVGLLTGPGFLGMGSPPVLLIHEAGVRLSAAAIVAIGLMVWFFMGFASGAVLQKRWAILGTWLVLAGFHVAFLFWAMIGALSH